MRRRELITLISGAAAYPLLARREKEIDNAKSALDTWIKELEARKA
jgi:hypothetical protein